MQQDGYLAGRRHDGSFLRVLSAALSQLQAPSTKSGVRSKWAKRVLRGLHQQSSKETVSFLGDAELGRRFSRLALAWLKPEVASDGAASLEAARIFEGQYVRQRRDRTDSWDLLEEGGLWITLGAQCAQLLLKRDDLPM